MGLLLTSTMSNVLGSVTTDVQVMVLGICKFHVAALDGLVTIKARVPSKTMEVKRKITFK